jgi:hypothetical protein
MPKVTSDVVTALKALFEYGDVLTEQKFADLIDLIADAAEAHQHTLSGGDGTGTGDAGPVVNLQSGMAAERPADPEVGDVWLETDTEKVYACHAAGIWTETGVKDHGELDGLEDDDHLQYLTEGRHDTADLHPANIIRGVQSGLDAEKPEMPAVGDAYVATDTATLYVCFTVEVWSEAIPSDINAIPGKLIDTKLANHMALRRLLSWKPEMACAFNALTWTGDTGVNYCYALAFDGTYIYAGTYTMPAKVVKIDPATMETVATWTGGEGIAGCVALASDGTYIYAGMYTDPAKVIKIDPVIMEGVATYDAPPGISFCAALVFDGTYIYAGLETDPAKVVKIDPATMEGVATWTGDEAEDTCHALAFDGTYIYVGLGTDPAKVAKIDPEAMETVDTWTAGEGAPSSLALAFDGTYIYTGVYTDPAQVIQIDPATMETVATWTAESGISICAALVFDGEHIYAGMATEPARVAKIAPTDMTTVSIWTAAAGVTACLELTFDGTYIFVGVQTSPAKVVRKILRDRDETES